MTNIQVITKDAFSQKSWKKVPNYLFAATHSACALTVQELPKALIDMPVGFIKSEDTYLLVAILGLHNDTNLYVGNEGQWIGKYPPAALRSYPFMLLPHGENQEQLLLCMDTDSGLLSEDSSGEPFFDKEGDLGESLEKVMGLLKAVHTNKQATLKICAMLDELGLIRQWDLDIQFEEGIHRVEGLYGIDEKVLNNLSDEEFLRLRELGALSVAYCQLLSMQNIEGLIQRAQAHSPAATQNTIKELDLDSFGGDGNITFDNF